MARTTVMTKEVISTLKECFLADMTDLEACEIAGICDKTLDNYEAKHPEFLRLKKQIRQSIKLKARLIIANGIEEGDKNDAKWFLERRDPDFKPKKETDVNVGAQKSLIDAILAKKAGKE